MMLPPDRSTRTGGVTMIKLLFAVFIALTRILIENNLPLATSTENSVASLIHVEMIMYDPSWPAKTVIDQDPTVVESLTYNVKRAQENINAVYDESIQAQSTVEHDIQDLQKQGRFGMTKFIHSKPSHSLRSQHKCALCELWSTQSHIIVDNFNPTKSEEGVKQMILEGLPFGDAPDAASHATYPSGKASYGGAFDDNGSGGGSSAGSKWCNTHPAEWAREKERARNDPAHPYHNVHAKSESSGGASSGGAFTFTAVNTAHEGKPEALMVNYHDVMAILDNRKVSEPKDPAKERIAQQVARTKFEVKVPQLWSQQEPPASLSQWRSKDSSGAANSGGAHDETRSRGGQRDQSVDGSKKGPSKSRGTSKAPKGKKGERPKISGTFRCKNCGETHGGGTSFPHKGCPYEYREGKEKWCNAYPSEWAAEREKAGKTPTLITMCMRRLTHQVVQLPVEHPHPQLWTMLTMVSLRQSWSITMKCWQFSRAARSRSPKILPRSGSQSRWLLCRRWLEGRR